MGDISGSIQLDLPVVNGNDPTIGSEIVRIEQAKSDIKDAIEAKGVTVGAGTIDTYAAAVAQIPTGGGGQTNFNAYKVASMQDQRLQGSQNDEYALVYDYTDADHITFNVKKHVLNDSVQNVYIDMSDPPRTITALVLPGDYFSAMGIDTWVQATESYYGLYESSGSPVESVTFSFTMNGDNTGTLWCNAYVNGTSRNYYWDGQDNGMGMGEWSFTLDQNRSSGSGSDTLTFINPISITIPSGTKSDLDACIFQFQGTTTVHTDRWDNPQVIPYNDVAYANHILQGKKAFTNNGIVTGSYVPPQVGAYNAICSGDFMSTGWPSSLPIPATDGSIAVAVALENRSWVQPIDRLDCAGGAIVILPHVVLNSPAQQAQGSTMAQNTANSYQLNWEIDSQHARLEIIEDPYMMMMSIATVEWVSMDNGTTYALDYMDITDVFLQKYPYIKRTAFEGYFQLQGDSSFDALSYFLNYPLTGQTQVEGQMFVYNASNQEWMPLM